MRASEPPRTANKILHVITDNKWWSRGRCSACHRRQPQAPPAIIATAHPPPRSLPVRGHRNHTNARTPQGPRKTVGVTKPGSYSPITILHAEEKIRSHKEKPKRLLPPA